LVWHVEAAVFLRAPGVAPLRNRLRGCAIEVQQISLDRYWDEAAVFEEETEKGSGKGSGKGWNYSNIHGMFGCISSI